MKIVSIDHHRNGICGMGFTVGIIKDKDNSNKLIIQFDDKIINTAVFDLDLLKKDVIKFGVNSWRGDQYCDKFKELSEIELEKQFKKLMEAMK